MTEQQAKRFVARFHEMYPTASKALTRLYQTRRAPIKELRAEIKHLRAKLREANRGAERNVYKVQNLLNELSVMTVECIDGDHYKRRIKELFENYDFKS